MPRKTRTGAASLMWWRWVVVVLVLGSLVGCGGQGGQGGQEARTETATSSDRPLPDPGPTTPDGDGPPMTTMAPTTNLYRVQVVVDGTEVPGVVTSDVGGISCPGTCFFRYPRGAPVTLTAQTEVDGQVFSGWEGACSSVQGSTCSLNVDESKEVTARYASTGP